jgi:peptide/nickel transport system substrate-binding protein
MSDGIPRRQFVAAAAALGLAPQSRAQSRAPEAQPLVIAVGNDRYSTDPQRFTFTVRGPHAQIAETPVRPDVNFLPAPLLFERWQAERGRYRVSLRAGLRFHDGSALDADAAIEALRGIGRSRSDFLQIAPDSFKRIDARSFEFASATGSNLVIENMSHRAVSLFSPATDKATAPSGTGPYRFVRYEPRQRLELRANPDYWGTKPLNERLVFRFVPDGQARLLALAKGEVDVVAEVSPQMLLAMSPSMKLQLHTSRPVQYVALLVNAQGQAPYTRLADPRVRRAVALAIDRPAIARTLYAGRGVPAQGLLPDWMFGLGKHTQGHGLDLAAAAGLLDDAGWRTDPGKPDGPRRRNGEALRLRLVAAYPTLSSVAPLPELLEQMLRKAGIGLDIVSIEDDQLYGSRYLDPGEGDLFIEHAGNNNLDPTFLLYNLFHSKTPWRHYRHMAAGPSLDAALDEARATGDPARRLDAVRRAHRNVVDEAVVAIPILLVPQFVLSRAGTEVPMFEHRDWIDYGAIRLKR